MHTVNISNIVTACAVKNKKLFLVPVLSPNLKLFVQWRIQIILGTYAQSYCEIIRSLKTKQKSHGINVGLFLH